jgi:hypothetical protein
MLFAEADSLAQEYVSDDGDKTMPHSEQIRLAQLMAALNRELGLPENENSSPLFVDNETDYLKLHNAQCIRKQLLEKTQNVVH